MYFILSFLLLHLSTFYFKSQVKAVDADPPDRGGKITYKFISTLGEKERFRVDAETGTITTADVSITKILPCFERSFRVIQNIKF